MEYSFFATVSRMKYIERWALMRNSRPENLSEHSLDVAMIAHALCTIADVRYGEHLDGNKAAVIALYHDAGEIITGDLPTPVKYYSATIHDAYKDVEKEAVNQLLDTLPEDLRDTYREILDSADTELLRYVKAADKLSAYIKCIEEKSSGNSEFDSALVSTKQMLDEMCGTMPALQDFMHEFLAPYGSTLDSLLKK